MFSKKTEKPYVKFTQQERRLAVRITPDKTLDVQWQKKRLEVLDLSVTGISLKGIQKVVGDKITLDLAFSDDTFSGEAEVVKVDADNTIHCHFEDISEYQQESIYQYILELQKQRIRKQQTARRNSLLSN